MDFEILLKNSSLPVHILSIGHSQPEDADIVDAAKGIPA